MDKDIKYWLALSRLKGIERFVVSDLIEGFGSAEGIFSGDAGRLAAFSPELARAVAEFDGWKAVDADIKLIDKHGVRVITFADKAFPAPLREMHDPPCLLYVKGSLYDAAAPAVAVVGTRNPTHYGIKMAETIAKDLAAAGVVIVSGMARGCDRYAHVGALSAKGFTVAVLGTGVDVVYPKEHRKLHEEISASGLVVSEFPMSTPPLPHHFLRRNRIISGLVRGVLVVEAPIRSGSLMTARLALDYNRDVFAVPGQVTSVKSEGTNLLIKQGAALIENAADVMKALGLDYAEQKKGRKKAPELSAEETLVWKALGDEPMHIDGVMEKSGLGIARVSSLLLNMELRGCVVERAGKRFSRKD